MLLDSGGQELLRQRRTSILDDGPAVEDLVGDCSQFMMQGSSMANHVNISLFNTFLLFIDCLSVHILLHGPFTPLSILLLDLLQGSLSGSFTRKPGAPALLPIWRLLSPPPNYDCNSLQCSAPLANSPPGSPCSCVMPIKVGLRLGIALYTFFPLVSELAQEIAYEVFLKESQVRIMGANAASEDPEKTTVLIDLVPLRKYFDNNTSFLIYERF